jgi:WD40 repeat protein
MTVEEALTLLDVILGEQRLKDAQELVFRQCWAGRTYPEIAADTNYSPEHIRAVGFRLWRLLSEVLGERVTRNNVRSVLRRYMQRVLLAAADRDATSSGVSNERELDLKRVAKQKANSRQDWGEAAEISEFYNRHQELERLAQWIVRDRCRLVTILGMGGIGKTTLTIELAGRIQNNFDYLIWRSLRHAPSPDSIVTDIIQFLGGHQENNFSPNIESKISYLIEQLRSCRCLLVLDNLESVLQSGDRTGHYRDGYQDYGQLLRRVGETSHQSCLLLTSRETPIGLAAIEGENLPVRSLKLAGLEVDAAKKLFTETGNFYGLESEWQATIEHYAGNPLALKMLAPLIKDFLLGNISEFVAFIKKNTFIFDDIYDLLERQFERLSDLEMQVMYWLAINREPVSLTELQLDFLQPELPSELLKALISLQRRSLIECNSSRFSQQPAIMEHTIEKIIDRFQQAIINEEIEILAENSLIKAQAQDYIRESQISFILDPLIDKLLITFKSPKLLESKLGHILLKLQKYALYTGYAAGNIINLLSRLKINFSNYNFSHLTIWQAYLANSNLSGVNFTKSDLSKSVFAETLNGIWSVAFSNDGQLLATADINCEVRLWQIPEGKQLLTCKGHTSWVTAVTFSPIPPILASSSGDRTLKLWDANTGQCLKTFYGHSSWISSVAFSSDGQTLASGSVDGTVKLWDVSTANCKQTLEGHQDWVRSVACSPDGKTVASGSDDRTIKIWDATTGECLKTLAGHTDKVRSVAFSPTPFSQEEIAGESPLTEEEAPGGYILASGSDDRTIKLWNVSTGRCWRTLEGHLSHVRSVTFSPAIANSQTTIAPGILASSSEDRTIVLWDTIAGKRFRVLPRQGSTVWSVAFSPIPLSPAGKGGTEGGYMLAGSSLDRLVKLWDTRTGQCLKTLQGQSTALWSVAISSDGQTIVAGSTDCTVKIWDADRGTFQRSLEGHTNWCWSVALAPISTNPSTPKGIAASASFDGTVRLWHLAAGKVLKILQGHQSYVMAVVFSPDGQTIASGSADQTIKIWDTTTGQCLKTLPGEGGNVWAMAFSPLCCQNSEKYRSSNPSATKRGEKTTPPALALKAGSFLASAHDDCTIKLWDVNSGLCLRTFQGHTNRVRSVAFSPSSGSSLSQSGTEGGYILASGSEDYTVKLWDVNTGQCLQSWQAADDEILSIAFSPDGKTLATSGNELAIKLWDINRRECLQVLQGHTKWVFSVTYSQDGKTLISASQDGNVRIWDVQTGECLKILHSPKPYEGMKITGATGLTAAQKATLIELGAID